MPRYTKNQLNEILSLIHFYSLTMFVEEISEIFILGFLLSFKYKKDIKYRNKVILWGDKKSINYLNKKARENHFINRKLPF